MEQYIEKSALVAKIEKRKKEAYGHEWGWAVQCATYDEILSILNTLEVKEVDLEKELIEWHKEHFKKDGTFIGMSGFYLTNNSQMDIAKHFYELGLKAQKGKV